ncbi:MAG: TrmH family RNA methyltransferase [Candidatus Kapaibacteriota bacterium]|jgi:tRNA G18 (ribose-2'-O)-methylase SpoU
MVEIKDLEDPRIAFYRSLRYTPISHIKAKVFIAEGEKVVVRLFRSALKIHSIFAILDFYERYKDLIDEKMVPENCKYYSDIKLMEQIVGFHLHSGVMAIGYKPDNLDLAALSPTIVALNGVNNSENVGQIARICRAFGVDSLISDEHSTSPFLRRAVRVSMGNVFYLKIRETDNLIKDLIFLKSKGYQVVSFELTESSSNLFNFNIPSNAVLVFGNEDKGVSSEVLNISDSVVQIPIQKGVDSLNVAVASAVALYELYRQKWYKNVVNG